jgi:hypothetical protein
MSLVSAAPETLRNTRACVCRSALSLLIGLTLAGCTESTEKLEEDYRVALARYAEATRTGSIAPDAAADIQRAKGKLLKAAAKGDPLACLSLAVVRVGKAKAIGMNGRVRDALEEFKVAQTEIECAKANHDLLPPGRQKTVDALSQDLPKWISRIESGCRADLPGCR